MRRLRIRTRTFMAIVLAIAAFMAVARPKIANLIHQSDAGEFETVGYGLEIRVGGLEFCAWAYGPKSRYTQTLAIGYHWIDSREGRYIVLW